MLGLVLEGGGAKGAFQAGAIKALFENNYSFDAVAGTSVGALNGAMVAQGEFEKSIEIWENMEISRLFDIDDEYAEKIAKMKLDTDTLKYFFGKLKDAVKNRGLDTTKIRKIIESYVDEEKIRNSKIAYGLVTFSYTERKAKELFIEEIPKGKLCDFIMASANFPGFQKCEIDDVRYLDGGLYDNLPINMMAERGFSDLIAVTTGGFARRAKVKYEGLNITYINPSEKPGTFLSFSNESVKRNLKIGYLDGMKVIKNFGGFMTYIKGFKCNSFETELLAMPQQFFDEMCVLFSLPIYSSNIINLVNVSAYLTKNLKLANTENIAEVFVSFIESVALKNKFDRLQILSFKSLIKKTSEAYDAEYAKRVSKKKTLAEQAFEIFYRYYR